MGLSRRSATSLFSPLRFVPAANDEPVGFLVVTGLGTAGLLAPRRDGVTAARGLALAAAVRVVDRVHGDAANRWALALQTVAASLADNDVDVVRVRHGADGGHADFRNHANFAGRQLHLGVAIAATNELGVGAGGAGDLAALKRLHFDIVDDGADRDALHWQGVARLDVDVFAGNQDIAHVNALRRDDIGLLAIIVLHQRDEGGAVGVIFQALDGRGHIPLATLEVDDAVALLRAAAAPARGAPAEVVAAAG